MNTFLYEYIRVTVLYVGEGARFSLRCIRGFVAYVSEKSHTCMVCPYYLLWRRSKIQKSHTYAMQCYDKMLNSNTEKSRLRGLCRAAKPMHVSPSYLSTQHAQGGNPLSLLGS